jgi:ATP-dependent DNA helicase RecG
MSTRPRSPRQLELDFSTPLPTLPQLWTPDDIYVACDQATISLFREDNRVERKIATISQKALSEYVSMWANTQPHGGITFIGVEDTGKVVGCKAIEQSHLNDLKSVRALCHDTRVEFKNVAVRNNAGEDDFVLVMRVYYREDKLVETSDGQAFVREGDRKRRLTETEKREIRLNKGELDVESERTSLAFPDDFNKELLNLYREEYISKHSCSLGIRLRTYCC